MTVTINKIEIIRLLIHKKQFPVIGSQYRIIIINVYWNISLLRLLFIKVCD